MSVWNNIKDSFIISAMHSPLGGGGLARAYYRAKGYSNDQINNAIDAQTKELEARHKGEHGFAHGATSLLGSILGGVDPTYAVGGGGTGVVSRAARMAAVQAPGSVVRQATEIGTGQRKHFDPKEVVNDMAAGAAFEGGTAAAGKLARLAKPYVKRAVHAVDEAVHGKYAPIAPDGMPGNASVPPIDPKHLSQIMNDPAAIADHGAKVVDFPARRINGRDRVPGQTISEADLADLPPANRQYLDATAEKPVVDNTGYEAHTPYVDQSAAPANDRVAYEVDPTDYRNDNEPHDILQRDYGTGRSQYIPSDHGLPADIIENAHQFSPEHLADMKARSRQGEQISYDNEIQRADAEEDADPHWQTIRDEHLTPAEAQEMDASAPKPDVPDSMPEQPYVNNIADQGPPAPANDKNLWDVVKGKAKQLIDDERGSLGDGTRFEELKEDPDGTKYLHYTTNSGEKLPIKMGIEPDGTAEIAVDQFGTGTNKLGPAEIREAMYGLMDQYPEIKRFGGYRRSGAGKGRVQEIEPAPRQTAAPERNLDHEEYRSQSYNADGKTVPAVRVFDKDTGETLSVARAKPFENKDSRIARAYEAAKQLAGDERGAVKVPSFLLKKKKPRVKDIPDDDLTPEQRVIKGMDTAEPMLRQQDSLRRQERAQRFEAAKKQRYTSGGEAGFHQELSKLSGEYTKLPSPYSIRPKLDQAEVDNLFDQVRDHPALSDTDTYHARTGLQKLLQNSGAELPTHSELEALRKVFSEDPQPGKKSVSSWIADVINAPRSIMASMDLSAPLRQGLPMIHRKEYWTAFGSMFKQIGQKGFDAVKEDIASRPSYHLMKDSRLGTD
jgi:hypothetical protein